MRQASLDKNRLGRLRAISENGDKDAVASISVSERRQEATKQGQTPNQTFSRTSKAKSETAKSKTAQTLKRPTSEKPGKNNAALGSPVSNLSESQEEDFHSAMVKLRSRKVPQEVKKMMREMSDTPDENEITL